MHAPYDTIIGLVSGIFVGLGIVAYTRRKRNQ